MICGEKYHVVLIDFFYLIINDQWPSAYQSLITSKRFPSNIQIEMSRGKWVVQSVY